MCLQQGYKTMSNKRLRNTITRQRMLCICITQSFSFIQNKLHQLFCTMTYSNPSLPSWSNAGGPLASHILKDRCLFLWKGIESWTGIQSSSASSVGLGAEQHTAFQSTLLTPLLNDWHVGPEVLKNQLPAPPTVGPSSKPQQVQIMGAAESCRAITLGIS